MNTYFITKAEANKMGHGFILSLALKPNSTVAVAMPIISNEDAWLLARNLEAGSPQNLRDKKIVSLKNDPSIALEFHLLNIKCGGCYNPPSFEEVRQKVAQAISKFRMPDLSRIDSEAKFGAFMEIWDGKLADPVKLAGFMRAVDKYSGFKTNLRWADPKAFPTTKSNVEYLQLIGMGGKKIQKLVMRPDLPVEFVD